MFRFKSLNLEYIFLQITGLCTFRLVQNWFVDNFTVSFYVRPLPHTLNTLRNKKKERKEKSGSRCSPTLIFYKSFRLRLGISNICLEKICRRRWLKIGLVLRYLKQGIQWKLIYILIEMDLQSIEQHQILTEFTSNFHQDLWPTVCYLLRMQCGTWTVITGCKHLNS